MRRGLSGLGVSRRGGTKRIASAIPAPSTAFGAIDADRLGSPQPCLGDRAALRGRSGNRGRSIEWPDIEAVVQLQYGTVEGVGDEHVHAFGGEPVCSGGDAELVVPRENQLVVINKAVVVVPRDVRRVEKYKIAGYGSQQRPLKVSDLESDARATNGSSARPQVERVDDVVSLWRAVGHVELAITVHAVEAVPAGLIEVDELGGTLVPAPRAVATNLVEQVPVGAQGREIPQHGSAVVTHRLVRRDQVGTRIAQRSAFGPQQEEQRTATDERLPVGAIGSRNRVYELP